MPRATESSGDVAPISLSHGVPLPEPWQPGTQQEPRRTPARFALLLPRAPLALPGSPRGTQPGRGGQGSGLGLAPCSVGLAGKHPKPRRSQS